MQRAQWENISCGPLNECIWLQHLFIHINVKILQCKLYWSLMKLIQWKWKLVIHKNDKLKQKRNSCELENNKWIIPSLIFKNRNNELKNNELTFMDYSLYVCRLFKLFYKCHCPNNLYAYILNSIIIKFQEEIIYD